MSPVATAHLDLAEFFDTITGDDEAVSQMRRWVQTVAGNILADPNIQNAWCATGDGGNFEIVFAREVDAAILDALRAGTLPSRYLLLVDGVYPGMVEAATAVAVAWMASTFRHTDAT